LPVLFLNTIAVSVFELVAVVAEFATFPEVLIVSSLVSAMLPANIAFVTTPGLILVADMVPLISPFRVPVKLIAFIALVAVPSRLPVKSVAITLAFTVILEPLRGLMVSVVTTSNIPLSVEKVVSLKSDWKLVSPILNSSRTNKKNNDYAIFYFSFFYFSSTLVLAGIELQ